MQRGCSICGGGYFCLVAVRMLTFIKCYYYHITESIQILRETEVAAMIRHAHMLPSSTEMEEKMKHINIYFKVCSCRFAVDM